MFEPLLRQFFGAVRHVIGTVIRAGLLGLVGGFLLVEILGAIFDRPWPAHLFVHIVAALFALVLGYAVAMTVAFFEGVRGIVGAVTQVEDEVEGAIRTAVEGTALHVGQVVDAVEHHPGRPATPQQTYPIAPPVAAPYNPNPAYGNPPYGSPQYGQPPQYGQTPTYPPTNPPYPPRQ
jgi:hypothetical protein